MQKKFNGSLLILLVLLILLRLPSLFEPYWYGDEGIYLSIGQALSRGWVLYRDIFDHKPPMIYWLASFLPNILAWKMLGAVMAIVGLSFFYKIAQILLKNKWLAWTASLIWVLLFNLPVLEGNVVNAEVLFIPLVLVGAYCWLRSGVLKEVEDEMEQKWKGMVAAGVAGVVWALSLLIKSQALLEVGIWILPVVFLNLKELKKRLPYLLSMLGGGVIVAAGGLIWSLVNNNLAAMIDSAVFYSLTYTSWASMFSGKTVVIVLAGLLGFLWWQNKHISWEVKIMVLWLFCSTVGTTLSGRNYAHYWLQLTGSVALGGVMLIKQLTRKTEGLKMAGILAVFMGVAMGSAKVLEVRELEAKTAGKIIVEYYGNFIKYMNKQQNIFAWYASFDNLVKDNYAVAPLISSDEGEYLLIWGNNPSLYAQTKKLPVSAYVTDYHLYDRVAQEEALNVWLAGLVRKQPTFVVVMNNDDESAKGRDWAGFYDYLRGRYERIYKGEQLELWQLF
ncbi:glycosyltransferase family 39 protein [Microgenomates group bacterium]|nr:glycosyltransferase family 39 protein [Microgenomates group bacterium]